MNNTVLLFCCIQIFGILLSSISQIILKKSTYKKYDQLYKEYMNPVVLFSYFLFFISNFIVMLSYRYVPLSIGSILDSTSYIFVGILGYFVLHEKISKRKFIGLVFIVFGVILFVV